MTVAVITREVNTVEGEVVDGRVVVPEAALPDAIGWELKAEGLCRDDVCVLVPDRAALGTDGSVDIAGVATLLGRRTVTDADGAVIAVSLDAEARSRALDDLVAPPFTLPDLDGNLRSLEEWRGRRRMLFAFSSW
ncbi:MAG: hypothetical protein ACR2QE_07920 [Acidimicrobiales bacterium]